MSRLALALALLISAGAAGAEECALEERDVHWLQTALDDWGILRRDILQAKAAPLPWMVLYDERCVFHLAPDETRLQGALPHPAAVTFEGQPVRVFAKPYSGKVELPSGRKIEPRIAAATSLYDDDKRTFFFSAMPSIWRAGARDLERPEAFALGVMAHELTHTLQLVPMLERIAAAKKRWHLPESVTDDIVQERFEKNRRFVRAWTAERDALDAAIGAADPAERLRLSARALELVRARQDRFYRGAKRGYRDLEEIFLAMEGIAVWAHWKLAQEHPERVFFESRRDHYWSQSEGYALMRLVDLLVPDWRARMLGPELASPLTLLAEAVRR